MIVEIGTLQYQIPDIMQTVTEYNTTEHKQSLLQIVQCKCPNCGKGRLFAYGNPYNLAHTLDMPEQCTECGVQFDAEPGFFFGTGYVSYGLSVGLTIFSFIISYLFFGLSFMGNSLYYWLAATALLLIIVQPVMMRQSRSIWLYFFRHKLFVPEAKQKKA
ncbi:hypothetical protein D3C87_1452310 [compost metagenome]